MELRQALSALALACALLPAAAAAQVERFALVVGNDLGQPPDAPLGFAESDAARMSAVLQEVGGVRPENLVLLRGQDAATVRRSLIAVNERIRVAGGPTVLIVFFSGHADAQALHLGASSLELGELEQLVRGSAAGFRLLIVDACRSGALTRVKGGASIPPFELRLSEKAPGEGAVFLTSSSASEDSQESEALQGSFFTHALISGLLGAADDNGDGRVTLEEAYHHAYESTVRASSRTLAGLQHPTFQYELRGQGDVVLATLPASAATRGWVELPAGRTWLLFRGAQDGPVVGEVSARDRARRLSLRAGRYFLRGRGPDVLLEGLIEAPAGASVTVDESQLARTAYARLVRKGGEGPGSTTSVEVEGRVRTALAGDTGPCPGVAAGVAVALPAFTVRPRVGYCRSGFTGPGISSTLDQWDLELSAVHVWDLRWLSLELGLTAGGSLLVQRFRTEGIAPGRKTAALQLSPVLGVSRELGDRAHVSLQLAGSTWLLRRQDAVTGDTSFGPSFAVRLALAVGVRL